MNKLLKIGTRVNHSGHGLGTIVRYNGQQANEYLNQHFNDALEIAERTGISLVNSFYDSNHYPYVVLYDSGYEDVYCDREFIVVK